MTGPGSGRAGQRDGTDTTGDGARVLATLAQRVVRAAIKSDERAHVLDFLGGSGRHDAVNVIELEAGPA